MWSGKRRHGDKTSSWNNEDVEMGTNKDSDGVLSASSSHVRQQHTTSTDELMHEENFDDRQSYDNRIGASSLLFQAEQDEYRPIRKRVKRKKSKNKESPFLRELYQLVETSSKHNTSTAANAKSKRRRRSMRQTIPDAFFNMKVYTCLQLFGLLCAIAVILVTLTLGLQKLPETDSALGKIGKVVREKVPQVADRMKDEVETFEHNQLVRIQKDTELLAKAAKERAQNMKHRLMKTTPPVAVLVEKKQFPLTEKKHSGTDIIYIPHAIESHLSNVHEFPYKDSGDTPVFWHVPKAGGTTVADILSHCYQLVSASKIGATEGHGSEAALEVNTYQDGGRYVNVDTSTKVGLERARQLGLAQSGLADVIVIHRFPDATGILFDEIHRGRVFTVLRDPVQRAVSMFYYLQRATWEPTYDPSLANMTLAEYATTKAEENWVVRFLTNEMKDTITNEHVTMAKEILRRKMVVGILEHFDDSVRRFEEHFGWKNTNNHERSRICQDMRETAGKNRGIHHPVKDAHAMELLAKRNWADVEVFQYALADFKQWQQHHTGGR